MGQCGGSPSFPAPEVCHMKYEICDGSRQLLEMRYPEKNSRVCFWVGLLHFAVVEQLLLQPLQFNAGKLHKRMIGSRKDSLISLRGSGSTPASPHGRRLLGQEQLAKSTRPPVQLWAALRALSGLPKVDPIVHLVQHFLYQRVRHLKVEQVLKAITIEQLKNGIHLTTSLRVSLKAGFSGKAGFSTPIWRSDLIW